MKNLIFYCLCLLALNANAQSKYFIKSLKPGEYINNAGNDIIEIDEQNYIICGQTLGDEFIWQPFLLIVDEYGNIKKTEILLESYSRTLHNMTLHNHKIIATGYSNPTSNSLICVANDSIQDPVFNFIGSDTMDNGMYNINLTTDNEYYLAGEIEPNSNSGIFHPYIIRLNANGEVLWDSIYYQFNHGSFREIKPFLDGSGYYVGGINNEYVDAADIIIGKLDNFGNLIWHHIYNNGEKEGCFLLEVSPDGGALAMIIRQLYDSDDYSGVIKYDTQGIMQWEALDYFRNGAPQSLCVLQDSSIIIGGSYMPTSNNTDAEIIKLSPSGQLIRQIHYGGEKTDGIFEITSTSDGGIIACGRTESGLQFGSNVYLLKLNCMGLLTEPAAAFSYQANADNNIVSFINQSQYAYPDSIDGGHYVWDFGDGSPPFVCGQGFGACPDTVLHSYTQERMYNISLTAIVCQDTSIANIQLMPHTNNGGTAVGIVVPIANGNFIGKVCPNPANAQINIAYDLPKSEKGTFTLYDINGKLLSTQTFENKGTLQISTDSLMPGIYLYETQTSNGFIDKGKLVLIP